MIISVGQITEMLQDTKFLKAKLPLQNEKLY